jgi:hypothetical protein
MKLNISFPSLEAALREVGGVERDWDVGGALEALDNALLKGIEVGLEDVVPLASGVLTYAETGRPVVLYIKSPRKDADFLRTVPSPGPRFHIAECATLNDMRGKNRFERYVVTDNRSGIFKVHPYDSAIQSDLDEIEVKLSVCRNCLKKLNHHSYNEASAAERNRIVESFDLDAHLTRHAPQFHSHPTKTDLTASKQGYGDKWKSASDAYRAHKEWRCEACGVDLSSHRHLLHCHHQNGNTSDNAWSNLRALCVVCHAEQPQHGWMRVDDEARRTIRALRC